MNDSQVICNEMIVQQQLKLISTENIHFTPWNMDMKLAYLPSPPILQQLQAAQCFIATAYV
jgi:GTP cyclohydrolase I